MKPLWSRKACDTPRIFNLDPSVCDECGLDLDKHTAKVEDDEATRRQKMALWGIVIEHGGEWSVYGGTDGGDELREHMGRCRIDWKHTDAPTMLKVSSFVDTFSDNEVKEILGGMLWCVCGHIRYKEIVVEHLSMGELIWLAAHADD
jgi:hypothetical protein